MTSLLGFNRMMRGIAALFSVSSIVITGICIADDDLPAPDQVIFRVLSEASIQVNGLGICTVVDPEIQQIASSRSAGDVYSVYEGELAPSKTLFVMSIGNSASAADMCNALESCSNVVRAEPNYYFGSDTEMPSGYYYEDVYPWYPIDSPDAPTLLKIYKPDYSVCLRCDPDHESGCNCDLPCNPPWWPPGTCYLGAWPETVDNEHMGDNWYIDFTQANMAWLVNEAAEDVIVAIIDSGVDWHHPDLGANMWQNLGEDIDGDGKVIEWDPVNYEWKFDPDDEGDEQDPDGDTDENGVVNDFVGLRIHGTPFAYPGTWYGEPTLAMNDPDHAICGSSVDVYGTCTWGWQSSHGSMMASIIAAVHDHTYAADGTGCLGISNKTKIMAINGGKTIETWRPNSDPDPEAGRRHAISVAEMIAALCYAQDNGAQVVNISLSNDQETDEMTELKERIDLLAADGIIICCSAGNSGGMGPSEGDGDLPEYTRYPASWANTLCAAAVRPDYVKQHLSSYASYVDFALGAGGNEVISSDFIVALKFTSPDPQWPDYVGMDRDPAQGGYRSLPHTYWTTWGQTSGAAAQLSGIVSIIKSVYPDADIDDVRTILQRGAHNVDAENAGEYWHGKLGAGVPNPYKALTTYGYPEPGIGEVVWEGDVWISGDYHSPFGRTLRILPGTTVHIANYDNMSTGSGDEQIILGAPNIICEGTPEEPITFDVYGYGDNQGTYYSISNSYGTWKSASFKNCVFTGLQQIELRGSTVPGYDPTIIEDCIFYGSVEESDDELIMVMYEGTIRNCRFLNTGSVFLGDNALFEWSRIEAFESNYPAIMVGGEGARIENSIVRDAPSGIAAYGSVDIVSSLIEFTTSTGAVGIDVYAGNMTMEHSTVRGFDSGVKQQLGGYCYIRSSEVSDCSKGLTATKGTAPLMNLGSYWGENDPNNDPGYNSIHSCTSWLVRNGRGGILLAQDNWWGVSTGPDPAKLVGAVCYNPYLNIPPYIQDPPDFALVQGQGKHGEVIENVYIRPNPANPRADIAFTLNSPEQVHIMVYDIRGRRVESIEDRYLAPGEYSYKVNGSSWPSGIYFVRLSVGEAEVVRKIAIIK